METTTVHVTLLEEGSPTAKRVEAIKLKSGFYELLEPEDYDPEDEIWEFLPGSVVKIEKTIDANGKKILLAVEKVEV